MVILLRPISCNNVRNVILGDQCCVSLDRYVVVGVIVDIVRCYH